MQEKSIAARRNEYRYAVYQHKLLASDGSIYIRPFIVIKNPFGIIIRFTTLHDYVGIFTGEVFAPLHSSSTAKLYYVCQALNYILIERYPDYGADHIFEIRREQLEEFFRSYACTLQKNGEYRSSASVEHCVSAVAAFFSSLCRKFGSQMSMSEPELVTTKHLYNRHGRAELKTVPAFQIRGIGKTQQIFRELPTKAFNVLMNLAFRYAPNIAFAMCLQAFAGLRAGEVCNIRQEQSPIGGSLTLTRIGSDVRKVEIDLRREMPMRSDGKISGRIKKERIQCVYPQFLDAFAYAYTHHKQLLSSQKYDPKYCPMFVNNRGAAMTYADYRNRFKSLVEKHFRPALLESSDPDLRLYGQMLCEHNLGLHALRHWYSVQLVLHGEDIAQVQYWRGDSNPESAFVYLQNKGDLVKELELVSNDFIEILLSESGRENFNEIY